MSVIGIVAEYNPFHCGHEYQIGQARKAAGEDSTVIAVMSGDFVQRGEPAVFSKYSRAEAACRCGADLVVELPVRFALSSAERFAAYAVRLLASFGATHLAFGCEDDDLPKLQKIAASLSSQDFSTALSAYMKENPNFSYAAARQRYLEEREGESYPELTRPNDILAIEYLKAIEKYGLKLKPVAVRRQGSGHDEIGGDGFRSASECRALLCSGCSLEGIVPAGALCVYEHEIRNGRGPVSEVLLETALLSRLRFLPESSFLNVEDAANGLGKRIYDAVRTSNTLSLVTENAKTRRFALSAVRRMIFNTALGISRIEDSAPELYGRVLAANEAGRKHLRLISGTGGPQVLIRPADVRNMSEQRRRFFNECADAHDLYTLSYTDARQRSCGEDWRTGPIIL